MNYDKAIHLFEKILLAEYQYNQILMMYSNTANIRILSFWLTQSSLTHGSQYRPSCPLLITKDDNAIALPNSKAQLNNNTYFVFFWLD